MPKPAATLTASATPRRNGARAQNGVELTAALRRMSDRFRRTREEAGLTLREVAERSGLAPSTVQKIENQKIVPSIAVAVRLAHALNRRASYFIEDDQQAPADARLIRRGCGRRLGDITHPLSIQQIAEPLVNPRMEAFLLTVQPGAQSGDGEPIFYRGEEIVVCTKGRLRFELRDEAYLLSPGDVLHFKGDVPHHWENPGPQEAAMIMVCAFSYG